MGAELKVVVFDPLTLVGLFDLYPSHSPDLDFKRTEVKLILAFGKPEVLMGLKIHQVSLYSCFVS